MIEAGDNIPEPNLWPTGLFGRETRTKLRVLIRQIEVNEALAQVATPEELAGQIQAWTPPERSADPAVALTG